MLPQSDPETVSRWRSRPSVRVQLRPAGTGHPHTIRPLRGLQHDGQALGASARRCAVQAWRRPAGKIQPGCNAAERQFRTPLRKLTALSAPTAQWTATAAGACLLRPAGERCAALRRRRNFGQVQDYKTKDINNIGCGYGPAAAATLCAI